MIPDLPPPRVMENTVAHVLALLITVGFFGVATMTFIGYVDIKDPTVAGLVGTVIGAISGKLDQVLARYFKPVTPPPAASPAKRKECDSADN